MMTPWIGLAAGLFAPLALAQTTIYKHVDASGRVTYSNRPIAGAVVVDLEPLSTVPGLPRPSDPAKGVQPRVGAAPTPSGRAADGTPVAVVTALPRPAPAGAIAERNRLEEELAQEETALAQVRQAMLQERRNPVLIAAVRQAQEATEATAAERAQIRANIDQASGRIRGLQATAAEHERRIDALRKSLGELKP
jgi:hypothetical protein